MSDIRVDIGPEDFDVAAEHRALSGLGAGAISSFVGLVRGSEPEFEGAGITGAELKSENQLLALDIEHYPAMTRASIESICQQAFQRWSLQAARVVHRVGRLEVGEQIVLVLVASAHRGDAFQACEFVMDYLKTQAPLWKKAVYKDRSHWIEARQSDKDRVRKWRVAD